MDRNGEVIEYIMPLEEFYEKYGFYPKKHPDLLKNKQKKQGAAVGKKTRPKKEPKNWNWSKFTKEEYLKLKYKGKQDSEIIEDTPWLNYRHLHKLKLKWGLIS